MAAYFWSCIKCKIYPVEAANPADATIALEQHEKEAHKGKQIGETGSILSMTFEEYSAWNKKFFPIK